MGYPAIEARQYLTSDINHTNPGTGGRNNPPTYSLHLTAPVPVPASNSPASVSQLSLQIPFNSQFLLPGYIYSPIVVSSEGSKVEFSVHPRGA